MAVAFPPVHADILQRAAGPNAYARGLADYQKGRVDLLSTGPARALATVTG